MKKIALLLACAFAAAAFKASAECNACEKCPSDCQPEQCNVCDDAPRAVAPKQELTPEEYALCEAMYKEMQEAYLNLAIHKQIEDAFQMIIDSHPEAAAIAKKNHGVDVQTEQGEIMRVLATPVYYINS